MVIVIEWRNGVLQINSQGNLSIADLNLAVDILKKELIEKLRGQMPVPNFNPRVIS